MTTTLRGTLATDPEIRYTREGQARGEFRLTVDPGDYTVTGGRQVVLLTTAGELAVNIALSLVKGSRVLAAVEELVTGPCGECGQHVYAWHAVDVGASLLAATVEVQRGRLEPVTD